MLHDEITSRVLTAAMKVHTGLGAGCLESTYDARLRYQLTKDGIVPVHLASSCPEQQASVSSVPPWWRF